MSAGTFRLVFRMQGKAYDVEQEQREVVLGRHPNCDLQVSGEAISRFHAKIIRDDHGWSIVDLKSVNGTQVNDKNVTKWRLKEGDVITLGSLTLNFHVKTEPQAVVYDDSESEPLMTQCINVDEFKQMLDGSGVRPGPATAPSADSAPSTAKPESEASFAWAFPVVSKAAQALLSCNDLDDMLHCVLDLVFENLPAERGCIFLYDSEKKEKTLRVTRTKQGVDNSFSVSTTITKQAIEAKNSVLASDTLADENLAEQHSIIFNKIRSAMCAPLYNGDGNEVGGLIYVDTQNPQNAFRGEHLEVMTTLAMLSSVALEQAELRDNFVREQQIRGRLERYCPAVVDRIISNCQEDLPDEMLAEELEVSILFLDLSGFTTLSENLNPGEVSKLLNDVFGRFTSAVFEYEGTLDKFMGDGMMAIFGAPLPQEDHAVRAVKSALLMQESLREFNESIENDKGMEVSMRIGINSGIVTAGDIGSPDRKDYTVIGDAVNVASRLESGVAKPGQVVIGSRTHELLGGEIPCEKLEEAHLKGRHQTVIPYLVTSAVRV